VSTEQFDAIVIGTGQAGPSLAARLAGAGRKVAILERQRVGGTCVNTGCIPTKTLIASARAAHIARRGGDFGVVIDGHIGIDMARVKARKDDIVRQSNQGVTSWLKKTANFCALGSMLRRRRVYRPSPRSNQSDALGEAVRRHYATTTRENYLKILEAFHRHAGMRLDRIARVDIPRNQVLFRLSV